MKRLVGRLPFPIEFVVVIGITLGYFIYSSMLLAIHPASAPLIDQPGLMGLLLVEPLLALLACGFLYLRQWPFRQLGLSPSFRGTLQGIVLAFASWAAYVLLYSLAQSIHPIAATASSGGMVSHDLKAITVLAVSIVNPFFEEVFVAGYVITALRSHRSPWFAVNVSVAIRLSYHLYQGPIALLYVIPVGLLFGLWYARTGRLWPLIVAHSLLDFTGLMFGGA